MAQDAKHHPGPCGQSIGEWFPVFPCILTAINGEVLVDVVAMIGVLDDDKDGVRIVDIEGYGEAKLGRQITLHIDPVVTSVKTLKEATVILLVEYFRLCRVLDETMDTLPKLRVFLWKEVGGDIFVSEGPAPTPIVAAHATNG